MPVVKSCLSSLMLASLCLSPLVMAEELKLEEPTYRVPDLGSPANASLNTTTERALGLKLVRELRGKQPMVEDPELTDWIQNLGQRLAAHAGGGTYYFLIEKNPEVNAYAMPGGIVVINSGLIVNSESESELAAVIAHEIAHVTQRHIARMMANSKNSPLLTGIGVLAGAAAATKSSEAAQAIITGTMAVQAQKQLIYSQQAESEADRLGLNTLASAGFDPKAMPYFLEKLDRRTIDTYGDLTQYLRTHPLTIDRISDTRSRANQLGNRGTQSSLDYEYAREKLRILSPGGGQAQGDGNVQHYAQAVRALKANNGRMALQALGNQNQPSAVELARAQALNLSGLYTETIALLQPLASAQPNNEAAAVLLAEAFAADNKIAQAWQVLNRVRLTETTSLEFLETRQRIAEQAGYTADAYISAAERSLRMGEYRHAQAALDQASRLPGTPAATMARLQAVAADIRRTETQAKQLDKQF